MHGTCQNISSVRALFVMTSSNLIIIIINTLQYSKRIEGQPTTRVGSPKKLKLNLLNYKTKVPRNNITIHAKRCTTLVLQGGVTSAHAAGRSATAVKVLTGEKFTLTLDMHVYRLDL